MFFNFTFYSHVGQNVLSFLFHFHNLVEIYKEFHFYFTLQQKHFTLNPEWHIYVVMHLLYIFLHCNASEMYQYSTACDLFMTSYTGTVMHLQRWEEVEEEKRQRWCELCRTTFKIFTKLNLRSFDPSKSDHSVWLTPSMLSFSINIQVIWV